MKYENSDNEKLKNTFILIIIISLIVASLIRTEFIYLVSFIIGHIIGRLR